MDLEEEYLEIYSHIRFTIVAIITGKFRILHENTGNIRIVGRNISNSNKLIIASVKTTEKNVG